MEYPKDNNQIKKYMVRTAFETLMEADRIKRNNNLMAKVSEYAEDQKEAISNIEDLKKRYDQLLKEEEEEEMPKKAKLKEEEDLDEKETMDNIPIQSEYASYKQVKEEEKEEV